MKTRYYFTLLLLLLLGQVTFAQEADFVYDGHDKRDPFWPLVSPGGAIVNYENDLTISDMVLEGIIAGSGDNNLAMINGLVVQQGDKVGLFMIEKIEKDQVVLRKGEETAILKLKKEEY